VWNTATIAAVESCPLYVKQSQSAAVEYHAVYATQPSSAAVECCALSAHGSFYFMHPSHV